MSAPVWAATVKVFDYCSRDSFVIGQQCSNAIANFAKESAPPSDNLFTSSPVVTRLSACRALRRFFCMIKAQHFVMSG